MAGGMDDGRLSEADDEIEFIPQARRALPPAVRPLAEAGRDAGSPAREALDDREQRSQGNASQGHASQGHASQGLASLTNAMSASALADDGKARRAAEPRPERGTEVARDQRLHSRFAPRPRQAEAGTLDEAPTRPTPPPLPQAPTEAANMPGSNARLFWVRLFTTLLLTTVMALVMIEWYQAGKLRDIAMGVIFLPLIVQSLAELFLPGRDHRALGLWSTDMVGAAALVVWALGGPMYFGVLGGAMLAIGLVMALLLSSKSPRA